jgi:D-alanyl-D-alanine carboxypeptidase
MSHSEPARIAARWIRLVILVALVSATATLIGVFDEESPAVTNLDPALRRAVRQAAKDAAKYEVEIVVNSGWRSPEYQQRLFRQAVSKYGSEEKAARWVATADTSSHVSGHAVDIGPTPATTWLSKHGARYGLCQIYRNEPWHYELRPKAIDHGCPSMYADPGRDPRMHQGPAKCRLQSDAHRRFPCRSN